MAIRRVMMSELERITPIVMTLACSSDTDKWERMGDKGQKALRKLTDGKRELYLCARRLH